MHAATTPRRRTIIRDCAADSFHESTHPVAQIHLNSPVTIVCLRSVCLRSVCLRSGVFIWHRADSSGAYCRRIRLSIDSEPYFSLTCIAHSFVGRTEQTQCKPERRPPIESRSTGHSVTSRNPGLRCSGSGGGLDPAYAVGNGV